MKPWSALLFGMLSAAVVLWGALWLMRLVP